MMLPHTLSGRPAGRVGYGTMGLGGHLTPDHAGDGDAVTLIHAALDGGAVLLDTAEVYGGGHCEELVGAAVRGRRDDVLIATKFSPDHAGTADVTAAAEASLRRLGTDTIDLFQMHWPNPRIPLGETLDGLLRLAETGKIRAFGLGNVTTRQIERWLGAVPANLPLVSAQQEYSLYERHAEHMWLPACRRHGLTLIAYAPLGRGKAPADGAAARILEEVAARHDLTPRQVMLAWLLRDPAVVAIPMSRSPAHIRANLAAAAVSLPVADIAALDAAFAQEHRDIPVDAITVTAGFTGQVYHTLAEARANRHGFTPSPDDLAREIAEDGLLKPVKVRPAADRSGHYELFEGQLRYWAWVIAHDGQHPIPAQVVGRKDEENQP